MKNLETKLEFLVKKNKDPIHGCPLCFWNDRINKPYTLYSGCGKNGIYAKIDRLIQKASIEECLTSRYLYVRNAKQYFIDKGV